MNHDAIARRAGGLNERQTRQKVERGRQLISQPVRGYMAVAELSILHWSDGLYIASLLLDGVNGGVVKLSVAH